MSEMILACMNISLFSCIFIFIRGGMEISLISKATETKSQEKPNNR